MEPEPQPPSVNVSVSASSKGAPDNARSLVDGFNRCSFFDVFVMSISFILMCDESVMYLSLCPAFQQTLRVCQCGADFFATVEYVVQFAADHFIGKTVLFVDRGGGDAVGRVALELPCLLSTQKSHRLFKKCVVVIALKREG